MTLNINNVKQGDAVVCFNGFFDSPVLQPFSRSRMEFPEEGKEYIVREKVKVEIGAISDEGILLEGVNNPCFEGQELCFKWCHFQPKPHNDC